MTLFVEPVSDVIAILPAAGIGRRMQTTLPKQYLTIGDKTILEHAIGVLLRQFCIREAIVAISPTDRWYHQLPVATDPRVSVVTGGSERVDSVMAAMRHTRTASWVLVHDAVRPCLHQNDLQRLLAIKNHTDVGGLLASPVRDTIKRAMTSTRIIASTVEREDLWHAFTPQLFARELLSNCLKRAIAEGAVVTDEASAIEYCGYAPLLVPGRADNIKVTCPEDFAFARCFLSQFANMENT
ncbi:2-C-methyl-D-erythritol 4-phosphate cytidylyltransferase [Sodalis endosymbiont of Henestaris halophilus]|uniref:2-C-methyl-D-erythritol 4-phosphate cytidylyltransferase n=1 Tax=Sodalis endosymbiont of Henestaris halophilus TaxID=1929246 RepID=UPI000BBF8FB9|nr:2-C-methyl-D-erythritol 4-phosphate cytidylyltransferase [Sodalis endosymbiont of Henestaris halophilus]SNC58899.1 2-C-methyl-D-erythritol 4-phosphate cytidylyltransferase [Sodalis endosymbiont of Henestaris halophilus]